MTTLSTLAIGSKQHYQMLRDDLSNLSSQTDLRVRTWFYNCHCPFESPMRQSSISEHVCQALIVMRSSSLLEHPLHMDLRLDPIIYNSLAYSCTASVENSTLREQTTVLVGSLTNLPCVHQRCIANYAIMIPGPVLHLSNLSSLDRQDTEQPPRDWTIEHADISNAVRP